LRRRLQEREGQVAGLARSLEEVRGRLAAAQAELERDSLARQARRDRSIQAGFVMGAFRLSKEFSIIVMPNSTLRFHEKHIDFVQKTHIDLPINDKEQQNRRLSLMLNGLGIKNKNIYSALFNRIERK
jgi:hypothetical protein